MSGVGGAAEGARRGGAGPVARKFTSTYVSQVMWGTMAAALCEGGSTLLCGCGGGWRSFLEASFLYTASRRRLVLVRAAMDSGSLETRLKLGRDCVSFISETADPYYASRRCSASVPNSTNSERVSLPPGYRFVLLTAVNMRESSKKRESVCAMRTANPVLPAILLVENTYIVEDIGSTWAE